MLNLNLIKALLRERVSLFRIVKICTRDCDLASLGNIDWQIQCDGLSDCCQITMNTMSHAFPHLRIVTLRSQAFGEEQTKVVKEVTILQYADAEMHGSSYSFLLHHIC